MPLGIRRVSWVLALLGCIAASGPALSAEREKHPHIEIEYVPPVNPAHQALYSLMKQRAVLERFRDFLSFIRLPHTLTLKLAGCDGESNAWYEETDRTITVCYEYLADVDRNAPRETTAAGVTPEDAVVGPYAEVFLHEIGHALFNMLHIPILGREEDAADQFAAYVLVSLDDDVARRTVGGVAVMYAHDARDRTLSNKDFANVHALDAQRLFNLLCIAYGSNSKLFSDIVEKKYLPEDRAEGCEDEYKQVRYAIQKLFGPYIDRAQAKKVRAEPWLKPAPGTK